MQMTQIIRKTLWLGLAVLIGIIHFFNANPRCEALEVGQVFEQVEAIMVHRKTIQKTWQHKFKQVQLTPSLV